MQDPDIAVRYWGAMGLLMRGRSAVESAHADLLTALHDESPDVRIVAAEALGRYGDAADLELALKVLVDLGPIDGNGVFTAMAAMNALSSLGRKAGPVAAAVARFPTKGPVPDPRYAPYVPRLLEDFAAGR